MSLHQARLASGQPGLSRHRYPTRAGVAISSLETLDLLQESLRIRQTVPWHWNRTLPFTYEQVVAAPVRFQALSSSGKPADGNNNNNNDGGKNNNDGGKNNNNDGDDNNNDGNKDKDKSKENDHHHHHHPENLKVPVVVEDPKKKLVDLDVAANNKLGQNMVAEINEETQEIRSALKRASLFAGVRVKSYVEAHELYDAVLRYKATGVWTAAADSDSGITSRFFHQNGGDTRFVRARVLGGAPIVSIIGMAAAFKGKGGKKAKGGGYSYSEQRQEAGRKLVEQLNKLIVGVYDVAVGNSGIGSGGVGVGVGGDGGGRGSMGGYLYDEKDETTCEAKKKDDKDEDEWLNVVAMLLGGWESDEMKGMLVEMGILPGLEKAGDGDEAAEDDDEEDEEDEEEENMGFKKKTEEDEYIFPMDV